VAVKRILRKYGYPPDKQEQAVNTVLQQAEQLGWEFADIEPAVSVPAPVVPFRVVPDVEARPYENCIPLYTLEAAAGSFGEGREVEPAAWVEPNGRRKVAQGLFVARVVGESMNRRIPNGAYCIFRSPVEGSRNDRVVLVQHREIADPETGGSFTVKLYERVGEALDPDGVRRSSILLKPDSNDPAFEPIALNVGSEDDIRVMAELVEVLPGVAT
jgi:hypothetical protein